MFLNPKKPIATCDAVSCDDCPVPGRVHCHFRLRDWVHFLLISLPSLLVGGAGIYHVSAWALLPWVLFLVAFFGFIEIRVLCSHCPHYAEADGTLKCWANYGSPKLWKYRPGPMTLPEKAVFFAGLAVGWGFPLVFLAAGGQGFLLLVYALATCGFFMTLKAVMCSQCMNFACPLNSVRQGVRDQFFSRNQGVAQAWSGKGRG